MFRVKTVIPSLSRMSAQPSSAIAMPEDRTASIDTIPPVDEFDHLDSFLRVCCGRQLCVPATDLFSPQPLISNHSNRNSSPQNVLCASRMRSPGMKKAMQKSTK